MTEAGFIAASVAMQLGGFAGPVAQSQEALLRALRGSSGSALAQLPGGGPVVQLAEGSLREMDRHELAQPGKATNALAQIRALGPAFGFIVDMQDRRVRSLAEPEDACWPVFCFNRKAEDMRRILWPLPFYHDLPGDHFLADIRPDAVPWEEKAPRVVWRGITGGRVMGTDPRDEGIRLKGILRRHAAGRLKDAALADLVGRLPRFHALAKVQGDPRFDFGFVDGDGYVIAKTPLHAPLGRPRLSRLEMQRNKYIAVLRGLDVGSSFYWVMNSGSVGFVMETPFQSFASGHFRAWEHYIPFREDCADLTERFDWAEAHPAECREMTRRAAGVCALLARPDLRARILRETVARVNAMERVGIMPGKGGSPA